LDAAELVLGADERLQSFVLTAQGAQAAPLPPSTPLGSVWKLFVYAYLVDTGHKAAPYVCTGKLPAEEVYCCTPGQSIGREQALVRSCGLFFAPERLALRAADWQRYWQQAGAPAWLHNVSNLRPGQVVALPAFMQALASVPPSARQACMQTLLQVGLEPRAGPWLSHMGATARIKTWSWHDAKNQRIGGFAGWLWDGTPLWLRSKGTSATVLAQVAPWLGAQLPSLHTMLVDRGLPENACVVVRFFSRYPLAKVQRDGNSAAPGPLRGQVKLQFANGQNLLFAANGQLQLLAAKDAQTSATPVAPSATSLRIEGRFGLNEYVARVIAREGTTQHAHAARALGVAARTYLARHAPFERGCYTIDDDSRTQRVAPGTPSGLALAAAYWSDGLILANASGRYHSSQSGPQKMAWSQAQAQAQSGLRWDEILQHAYGDASLRLVVGDDRESDCQPLPQAQQWLVQRVQAWQGKLRAIQGFEAVHPVPTVCALASGNPYADIDRNRIYATDVQSANGRLTLVHEYLHFGLAHHPLGRDEVFVERTARALLGVL
jgi:uncharacterized protein YfaQ (DUF2300 family)